MAIYSAKILETIEHAETMSTLKVGVFQQDNDHEEQIGEYTRNFPSLHRTFFHFRQHDQDYALYSPHYTATRIIKLPSCEDIGGESPDPWGFCPLDFFVPSYIIHRETVYFPDKQHVSPITEYRTNDPTPDDFLPHHHHDPTLGVDISRTVVGLRCFYPFGFVAGCLWGDETLRLQYLDLSQVEQGILRRDARFGVLSLPPDPPLSQLIHYHNDDTLTITTEQHFRRHTGKRLPEMLDPEFAQHFFHHKRFLSHTNALQSRQRRCSTLSCICRKGRMVGRSQHRGNTRRTPSRSRQGKRY